MSFLPSMLYLCGPPFLPSLPLPSSSSSTKRGFPAAALVTATAKPPRKHILSSQVRGGIEDVEVFSGEVSLVGLFTISWCVTGSLCSVLLGYCLGVRGQFCSPSRCKNAIAFCYVLVYSHVRSSLYSVFALLVSGARIHFCSSECVRELCSVVLSSKCVSSHYALVCCRPGV